MIQLFGYVVLGKKDWDKLDARIKDMERQFVTKRNDEGQIVETLADVPIEARKERADLVSRKQRGMTWTQRRAWLEATDGGRKNLG
jgi:hypothetical protein